MARVSRILIFTVWAIWQYGNQNWFFHRLVFLFLLRHISPTFRFVCYTVKYTYINTFRVMLFLRLKFWVVMTRCAFLMNIIEKMNILNEIRTSFNYNHISSNVSTQNIIIQNKMKYNCFALRAFFSICDCSWQLQKQVKILQMLFMNFLLIPFQVLSAPLEGKENP